MKCGIIGAGLSGLACADALRAAGHHVTLFDKGRGPGGRMASRFLQSRFGDTHIDHGAQCFIAEGPLFRQAVSAWQRAGVVVPWPEGGADAWVGVPRMSAVIRHLAQGQQVLWNTFVSGILRDADGKWHISSDRGLHAPFDIVVTAVPAEQAVPILALYDLDLAKTAATADSTPCWAGLLVFQEPLPVQASVRHDIDGLTRAVCNRSKPMRAGPEAWIVHATPEWSVTHLEEKAADVAPLLLDLLVRGLGLAEAPPCEATAHRWRYAYSEGLGLPALWNDALRLGACGDWLLGPRAECAWLSGVHLARRIIDAASADEMTRLVPHLGASSRQLHAAALSSGSGGKTLGTPGS